MDLRRFLTNVAAITLMLATTAAIIAGGIWLLLFIGEHAYNYNQVCQLC